MSYIERTPELPERVIFAWSFLVASSVLAMMKENQIGPILPRAQPLLLLGLHGGSKIPNG